MAGRISAALLVIVTVVVGLRFTLSEPSQVSPADTGAKAVGEAYGASVLGIRAFLAHPVFKLGDHPGLGRGRQALLTTTTVVNTTATTAPATTASTLAPPAPTTTAVASPTSAPASSTTTTRAPTTTLAPATTAPPATTTTTPATTAPAGVPSGAIVIQPGTGIQAVVDSNPAGSTFYLLAGEYRGQTVKPRNGDTFLGEAGAVLNGEDRIQFAFRSSASNVTIRGIVVERYANQAGSGAIDGAGTAWRVIGNEVRYNWGGGITLGDKYQVVGNYVHHNRQIGIKGRGSGVLIENNEIAFNNYRDDYSMGWEAGGTKFVNTTNLVVRGNYVHDNHGHALWTDGAEAGALYENNVVINNYGAGIFHEISMSAVIRNNRVEGNAFPFTHGGIRVFNSSDVEVYGNTVRGNDGGIFAGQDDRGGYQQANLWVHDNVIAYSQGVTGLIVNSGGDVYYTGKNNRFDRNSYNLNGTARPFFWMHQDRTAQEWKAYGQDVSGSLQN